MSLGDPQNGVGTHKMAVCLWVVKFETTETGAPTPKKADPITGIPLSRVFGAGLLSALRARLVGDVAPRICAVATPIWLWGKMNFTGGTGF